MKRFFGESVLDEREMQELYRIEHAGLWALIVLLFAAVIIQLALGAPGAQVAGEAAVLMLGCAAMMVAYARHGIWDEHSRPSMRGNAVYCAQSALAVFLLIFGLTQKKSAALIGAAAMFAISFLLLTLIMRLVRRRQQRCERELDEEIDDEIDS